MEYLASTAVHFSICSSDAHLINTNITIRAHAKCSVNRLTQYVHYVLGQRNIVAIPEPGELQLIYKDKVLSGETTCRQIETEYHGVVRLRLERKNMNDTKIDLSYDSSTFLNTGVQIEMNVLSIDKVHKVLLEKASTYSTVFHLASIGLKALNEYEQSNSLNMCSIRGHEIGDVVGLDIAGRSHVLYLSDSTIDLTLSDLLGVDFSPYENGYCSLLCKVKHQQTEDNGVTVEFVSDAKFTIDRMVVNTNTTVLDVKHFICSVYAHALRLTPHDIKLIYNGSILHEKDETTNEVNRILKFIPERLGAKLHVYINHDYHEPGPGFWRELLFADDRFAFMPGTNLTPTETTSVSGSETGTVSMMNQPVTSADSNSNVMNLNNTFETTSTISSHLPSEQSLSTISRRTLRTEEGASIIRSYENFEKVTINGESFFVPLHQLENEYYEIIIGNDTLRLSSNEVYLSGENVTFSSMARMAIENVLGEHIKPTVYDRFSNTNDVLLPENANPDLEINEQHNILLQAHNFLRLNFARIFSRERIGRIFVAIISNLGVWVIVSIQLYQILPLPFFLFLSAVLIGRLIFLNYKISPIIRKIVIGSEDHLSDIEITQIKLDLTEKNYDIDFFEIITKYNEAKLILCECLAKNDDIHTSVLAEVLANSHTSNTNLNQNESTLTNESLVHQYLQQIHNSNYQNLPLAYSLCESLLNQLSTMLTQQISSLPAWARDTIHNIRKLNLAKNRPKFPKSYYIKLWLDIYRPWEYIYDTTLMRYIVPNPRTDRVLVGLLKNFILFFILIIPGFEGQLDQIIQERLIEQS